jgi:hypothetical protein
MLDANLNLTFWNILGLRQKIDRNYVHYDMFSKAISTYDCIGLTDSRYDEDDPRNTVVDYVEIPGYMQFQAKRSSSLSHGPTCGLLFFKL